MFLFENRAELTSTMCWLLSAVGLRPALRRERPSQSLPFKGCLTRLLVEDEEELSL